MPTKPVTVGDSIWSLTELIAYREAIGHIVPPFSTDERLLTERVASAYYFYSDLMELPASAPFRSTAGFACWFGIDRVLRLRNEQPTSPGTRR
jgi:hypothetical protein